MTTKIHIVDCKGSFKIIESDELKEGCIKIRHYEDDGDSYYDEPTPATIKETFLVKLTAELIRNDRDHSKLNACTMSRGFAEVDRLAYSYSVVVMTYTGNYKVWESDLIYSHAGIRATNFDMYSYHFNEPEQAYDESRLTYELFESLNLYKILSKYLPKADVRDSVIDNLLSDI
jgi:hypothetical protein